MDPLSIISGVAGIASAGTALVSSLYTLVKTVRNAPREMRDVAKEMTSLTSALEYLVEIISDGHSIATRQYLSGIKSVLGSIESTQNEIMDMIVDRSILSRWKWRRAKSLLEDVRAHQNMVSMQVAILNLGMLKKNFGRKEKATERRLTRQAESLVQASSAYLEATKEHPLHYAPPPPRSAPPPFETASLYGDDGYDEPSQPLNSTGLGGQPSGPDHGGSPREHPAYRAAATSGNGRGLDESPPASDLRPPDIIRNPDNLPAMPTMSGNDKSDGNADEAARRQTLLPYRHNSPGDAATLLYNLVFLSATGEDSGYESDQADFDPNTTHELSVGGFHSSDDNLFGGINGESRMANGRGTGTRRYGTEASGGFSHPFEGFGEYIDSQDPPSKVVNSLLLKWTSLTSKDVEESAAGGVEDYAENDRIKAIRGTVAAIAAENRKPENNGRPVHLESSSDYDTEFTDDTIRTSPREKRSAGPSKEEGIPGPRAAPYDPYGGYGYGGYGYGGYFNPWVYPPPPPPVPVDDPNSSAPKTTGHSFPYNNEAYSNPFAPNVGRRGANNTRYYNYYMPGATGLNNFYSFKQPNVLILNRKHEIDEEKDFGFDNLDVLNKGFRIERQRHGETFYNPASFLAKHGLQGEGILGALVASRSNATDSELWRTLQDGFDFQIPYTRSSDLGETWFLGERPVFVIFYHSSYQPQFYPIPDDNKLVFDREYVAIGEQWISDEALQQLGIVPRRRENGKMIFDPSISTSELKGLVDLSQNLLWIKQRRQYAKVFNKPVETFRAVHCQAPTNLSTTSFPNIQQPGTTERDPGLGVANQQEPTQSSHKFEIISEDPKKVEDAESAASTQPQSQPPTDNPNRPPPEPVILEIPPKPRRERRHTSKSSRSLNTEDTHYTRLEQTYPERQKSRREHSGRSHTARERSDRDPLDRRSSRRSSHSKTASENSLYEEGHRRRKSDGRRTREDKPPRRTSPDSGVSGVFSFFHGRN